MKGKNILILGVAGLVFLISAPVWAADDVIPATSDDIKAFDQALTQTQDRVQDESAEAIKDQARTRTRTEKQNEDTDDTDTDTMKKRVRTRVRAENRKALKEAVAEEAQKMKKGADADQDQLQERVRERVEERVKDGQGTMEQSRVMRDQVPESGPRQNGEEAVPSGPAAGEPSGSQDGSGPVEDHQGSGQGGQR